MTFSWTSIPTPCPAAEFRLQILFHRSTQRYANAGFPRALYSSCASVLSILLDESVPRLRKLRLTSSEYLDQSETWDGQEYRMVNW